MQDDPLFKNIDHLLEALRLCRSKALYVPALLLAYAGIDILASLDRIGDDATTRKCFVNWVELYLLPNASLPCDATDLYAARCAVVHTFGPESKLATKGEAKRIVYAFGDSTAKEIEAAIAAIGIPGHDIAVHVDSILDSFERSVRAFRKAILDDLVLRKRVEKNSRFFSGVAYGQGLSILDIRMG